MENKFFHDSKKYFFSTLATFLFFFLSMNHPLYSKMIKKFPDHIFGEIVVKISTSALNTGKRAQVLSSLQSALGEKSIINVRAFKTDSALHVIRLSGDQDVSLALAHLRKDSWVEFAEPNFIYRALDDGATNDPDFSKLWGMKNNGQADTTGQLGRVGADINVLPLWKSGIIGDHKTLVGVIDTGISWSHPDLIANLYLNAGESGDLAGNVKDDDVNGFIDDVHGWNFANDSNQSQDDNNHGSHCSGTIGATGNNGVGVVGVNWNVMLLPIKFLDESGSGTLEGAVNAINYGRKMKVRLLSNSWGGKGESKAMKEAIAQARDAGILFVAAAGNNSDDNNSIPVYPGSYPVENVVSVAAIDNQQKIATFSNWGKNTVHVAAPGVKILSTDKTDKYITYSGTSMATPHVAGVAALLWSANPTWTFTEIKNRLIETSEPIQSLRRKIISMGRVSAYNAFHNIKKAYPEPDESKWKEIPQTIESEHPYRDNTDQLFTLHQAGAKFMRVRFEKLEFESDNDFLTVETKEGDIVSFYTGTSHPSGATSDYIVGDTAVVHLVTDHSVTRYGFKVGHIEVID